MKSFTVLLLQILLAVNIHITKQCPYKGHDAKLTYKSDEVTDQTAPITLATIKRKLKESKIFDWEDPTLNEREKKEMDKLFETVEIMVSTGMKDMGTLTASRARQPFSVQNMFASLRLVERVVKKQLKEGQISESLASKFKWEKLSNRTKREKPMYYIDKLTNMRVFNMEP